MPRFLARYIKDNSPSGYMLNTWQERPQYDLNKGSYLCATCDNEVFSKWENHFRLNVWPRLIDPGPKWNDEDTLKFLVSLAYRYTLHFLATSPIAGNRAYSTFMRNLMQGALKDVNTIGQSLYVYPYVYRTITAECALLPGVNLLLSLGVHGRSLPAEGLLPDAMLVMIPSLLVLFCVSDLAACGAPSNMKSPKSLCIGGVFDPRAENVDMPVFLYHLLNEYIGNSQAHQKHLGLWRKFAHHADQWVHPTKICYVANRLDKVLLDWQKINCPRPS